MENVLKFENVEFNKENQEFTVFKGSEGTYSYTEIVECEMLNENIKYTGKEEPFTHHIYASPLQMDTIFPKNVLVGIKLVMKDTSKVYIYVSNEKVQTNSLSFYKDRENAIKIRELVKKIIKKYQ